MRRKLLFVLLLAATTLFAYWPLRNAQFLNFDDPQYVTNNPHVFRGITGSALLWAFGAFHAANWHPLTWISHMLDCALFGEWAPGHHAVNVLLHILNAILLTGLLSRLTGKFWRSSLVAAFFALHPLHVESVAWISERKDVLCTHFLLLSLRAYAEFALIKVGANRPAPGPNFFNRAAMHYARALLFFVCALLSKPLAVTLPFLLLLLDYWPLCRLSAETGSPGLPWSRLRPLILEKWPFFLCSVASCIVTFLAQAGGGAVATLEKVPLLTRTLNVFISYTRYLEKTAWPTHLAVSYPLNGTWSIGEVVLGIIVPVVLTALAWRFAKRAPYFAVGWFWFLSTLVPMIGIIQVGAQSMADRYTYVPLVGIFLAVVWSLAEWLTHTRPALRLAGALAGGALAMSWALLTWQQAGYWKDSTTLFTHAVAVSPDSAAARHNLGHALTLDGHLDAGLAHLNEAIRLEPKTPQAFYNRGNVWALKGDLGQAIADYQQAIRLKPNFEQAYYTLGKAFALQQRFEEARTNFLTALHWKPDYSEAASRLGNLFLLQGAREEGFHYLRFAVQVRPDLGDAHYQLGSALAREKKFAEAVQELALAVKLDHHTADARNDLAWILSAEDPALRNPAEAVRLAQEACRLSAWANPLFLDTLAVAFAASERWDEAVRTVREAISLVQNSDQSDVLPALESHLAQFASRQCINPAGQSPSRK